MEEVSYIQEIELSTVQRIQETNGLCSVLLGIEEAEYVRADIAIIINEDKITFIEH